MLHLKLAKSAAALLGYVYVILQINIGMKCKQIKKLQQAPALSPVFHPPPPLLSSYT